MISDEMYSRGRNESDEFFEEFHWGELEMGRSIAIRLLHLVEDVSVIRQ